VAYLMEPNAPTAPKPEEDRPAWVVCADCDAPVPAFHEDAATAVHGITVWADCPDCNVTGISADRTLDATLQDLLTRCAARVNVCQWRIDGLMGDYDGWTDIIDKRNESLRQAVADAQKADDDLRPSAMEWVKTWVRDVEDAHAAQARVFSAIEEAKERKADAERVLQCAVRFIQRGE